MPWPRTALPRQRSRQRHGGDTSTVRGGRQIAWRSAPSRGRLPQPHRARHRAVGRAGPRRLARTRRPAPHGTGAPGGVRLLGRDAAEAIWGAWNDVFPDNRLEWSPSMCTTGAALRRAARLARTVGRSPPGGDIPATGRRSTRASARLRVRRGQGHQLPPVSSNQADVDDAVGAGTPEAMGVAWVTC